MAFDKLPDRDKPRRRGEGVETPISGRAPPSAQLHAPSLMSGELP